MTSLMPETIEPATGGSAGGPGGTLPLPKAKKARVSWTQREVVALVQAHENDAVGELDFSPHTDEDVAAKLVALGLVEKPGKPELSDEAKLEVIEFIEAIKDTAEPEQTLQIRYAIKSLRALRAK